MVFENLWPLVFVAGVPVIILLYLLHPKGTRVKVPSNLIWRKIVGANKSASFWQKFISDPLLYLEILIMLLLVAAIMSPLISSKSGVGGSTVILLDTGAGMQHKDDGEHERFESAREYALGYLAQCSGEVSLITCDENARILASKTSDHGKVKRILKSVSVTDLASDMTRAGELAESLEADRVLVLTDAAGAAACPQDKKWEIIPFGGGACNLAVTECSAHNGDVMAAVVSYADAAATFDVSLYNEEDKLLATTTTDLQGGEQKAVLFEDVPIPEKTAFLRAELSDISFENSKTDSLEKDNLNYIFLQSTENSNAAIIGDGNKYIEKAYEAITGNKLLKLENETLLSDERIAIFDANVHTPDANAIPDEDSEEITETNTDQEGSVAAEDIFASEGEDKLRGVLRFGYSGGSAGKVTGVEASFVASEVTGGIEDAVFGLNESEYYDLPSWARSFAEADGKCVGYYGIDPSGIRRIVCGFDIRESDLPLLAEFPVWMAESLSYLSDQSILDKSLYVAGEKARIHPSADYDSKSLSVDTKKTGLYTVKAGNKEEYYGVLFPMQQASDGRSSRDASVQGSSSDVLVRRSIRRGIILLLILLLLIDLYVYVKRQRYRGRAVYIVRALLLLLMIAALLDLRLPGRIRGRATIFLADLSESNLQNKDKMESYLASQIEKKPGGDQYGLVTFGRDAVIDQFLTKDKVFANIMSTPDAEATDLESAVSKGISMLPDGASGRLVLLTDGRQNAGDLSNMEDTLKESGIELCALLTESASGDDAYISDASMPQLLHPGDAFRVNVSVESSFETDAVLSLYSKSRKVEERSVHLEKGSNNFAFQAEAGSVESESFEVKVSARGDSCDKNDSYHLYARVRESDKLLIVSGMQQDSGQLSQLLSAANVSYDVISAKNAPGALSEMIPYRAILLDNVYIGDLPSGFLEDISTYVRDYGCGLIVTGGEDSFALGGWRDSVLEDILPVEMEPEGLNESPSMAMVMVIDHSGSMTVDEPFSTLTRLDLAVEAASRAVDNLSKSDLVGVLTFDDHPTWQVPITKAEDKKAIQKKIAKIDEGGGTMIYPALQEAYEKIAAADAPVKHILLLTDGEGETDDFSLLTDAMKQTGITLSTVAMGEDSDQDLLKRLASACGGRYYYSDSRTDIPRIFAKEVLMNGKAYLQNGDFSLEKSQSSEITKNLYEDGWPHIGGYVATSAKGGARLLLESSEEDPVLSVWQYGLGRTVAWSSDTTGVWSGSFAGSEDYVTLWKRICDYGFGSENEEGDRVEVVSGGADTSGQTLIRYLTTEYGPDTTVKGVYTTPEGEQKEIALNAKKPGEFEAQLSESKEGIYYLSLKKEEKGESAGLLSAAALLQYSDEYRFDVTDAPVRSFLEENGRILEENENVWTRMRSRVSTGRSLVTLLLCIAGVLFLMDVAMRRLELERILGDRIMAARRARAAGTEAKRAESRITEAQRGETQMAAMWQPSKKELRRGESDSKASEENRGSASETGPAGVKKNKKNVDKITDVSSKEEKQDAVLDTSLLLKKKKDRGM
ncbi:MAG: VWA domain-containing protein [Lachnospiraceae bacterium]|nr:VWA domain-containing protein [Lachnospiraceae bacterium]